VVPGAEVAARVKERVVVRSVLSVTGKMIRLIIPGANR
jgi:hypothetical protein